MAWDPEGIPSRYWRWSASVTRQWLLNLPVEDAIIFKVPQPKITIVGILAIFQVQDARNFSPSIFSWKCASGLRLSSKSAVDSWRSYNGNRSSCFPTNSISPWWRPLRCSWSLVLEYHWQRKGNLQINTIKELGKFSLNLEKGLSFSFEHRSPSCDYCVR